MTDGIDIKTPRKVKREGEKAGARAPAKGQVKAPVRKVAASSGPARTARPVSSASDAAPAGSRKLPPAARAASPGLRPAHKNPPRVEKHPGQAALARRPAPSSPKPARREKNLEGLGRLLKTKREIQGMTRRDVVVKIKIPLDQLEAIEEGRLSSLPPVFAKGFLRAYANELGLDAEAILEDYRQLTGGFKNEPASREPLAPRYVETSVGGSPGSGVFKMLVICMAGVLLIGGLVLWLLPGLRYELGSLAPFLENLPGFTQTNGDKGPYTTLTAGGSGGETDQIGSPIAIGDNGGDVFLGDPIDIIDSADPGALPIPVAQNGGILTLASRMDKVWLEVQVDGENPQFFLMKSGQELTLRARRYITVTTGQGNAVSANWNGRDIGSLSSDDKPVTKATFPRGI